MVATFGAVQGTRWAGTKALGADIQVELLEGPEDSLRCSYKYMFQRLRDVRNGETEKFLKLLWKEESSVLQLQFIHVSVGVSQLRYIKTVDYTLCEVEDLSVYFPSADREDRGARRGSQVSLQHRRILPRLSARPGTQLLLKVLENIILVTL